MNIVFRIAQYRLAPNLIRKAWAAFEGLWKAPSLRRNFGHFFF
jgi:hypothetical protein